MGIASAITSLLTDDAYERGSETVFLSAQNETVARIYERLGFRRVGLACVAEPAPNLDRMIGSSRPFRADRVGPIAPR